MGSAYSAMLFINASMLVGAVWMIMCGAKTSNLGLMNQGMLLIAIGVWIHFMDANFDLIAKGLAFIATGVAFLVINALVRRTLRSQG